MHRPYATSLLAAPPRYARVAKRWSCAPDEFYNEVGFRVARTLSASQLR